MLTGQAGPTPEGSAQQVPQTGQRLNRACLRPHEDLEDPLQLPTQRRRHPPSRAKSPPDLRDCGRRMDERATQGQAHRGDPKALFTGQLSKSRTSPSTPQISTGPRPPTGTRTRSCRANTRMCERPANRQRDTDSLRLRDAHLVAHGHLPGLSTASFVPKATPPPAARRWSASVRSGSGPALAPVRWSTIVTTQRMANLASSTPPRPGRRVEPGPRRGAHPSPR